MKIANNPGQATRKIRTSKLVKGVIFALSAFIAIGAPSIDAAQASASYSGHGYTAVQTKSGRPVIRSVDANGARVLAYSGYSVTKTQTFTITEDYSTPVAWVQPAINEVASDGTIVAIVDTGVDDTHEWFANRITHGRSFVEYTDPETGWRDEQGHGTHVAGIVRQSYPAAQIMAVRVLDASGSGIDFDVANGILWAVDNGAQVINMSFGGPEDAPSIRAAIQYAKDHNVITVVAAGNEGEYGSPIEYPAAYPTVLAVGAVDSAHEIAVWSNRGTYVDIVAQGVEVMSAQIGGGYVAMSGTSMATPNAAGIVARIKALHPDWSEKTIRGHVEATSTDLGVPGPDSSYGWGEINAAAAVGTTGPMSVVGAIPAAGELTLDVIPFVWGVELLPANNVLDLQVIDIDSSLPLYSDRSSWGGELYRRLSLTNPVNVMILGSDLDGTPFAPIYRQLVPLPVQWPKIVITGTGANINIRVTVRAVEGIRRIVVYKILASGQAVDIANKKLQTTGKTVITVQTKRDQYRSTRYQACLLDYSGMPFGCSLLAAAK